MMYLSMWLLVATLGQAPADTGLFDAVPAEADLVVRTRGLEATRVDLVSMIKAMSPTLAEKAEPVLEQGLAHFKMQFGAEASTQEFLTIVRAVPPEDPAHPPFAIIVKSDNYEGVIKSLAGGKDPNLKHDAAGYDTFDGPGGQGSWYSAKGTGTVAFGPDKILVAAFAKPKGSSVGKTLTPALRSRLTSGDIGVYVNLKSVSARYGEQIDQAKQAMFGAFDQLGKQAGNAAMMDMVKTIYAGLFDGVKDTEAFALSLDFAAEGLTVDGGLTVKADSPAGKMVASAHSGDAAGLAKLPADSAYYFYMNLDAKTFQSLQKMGMGMMTGGKPSPELDAALAKLHQSGQIETIGAMTMSNGMQSLSVMTTDDPKGLLALTEASMKAMKGTDSPLNFFKELTVTPNAETFAGFTFTRIDMKIDLDKFAKDQPANSAAAATLKAMYGGDKVTAWYGVSDTQVLQVMAPSWDKAKEQIDRYTKGESSLGATAAYKDVRAKLAKSAGVLGLISVQGLAGQFATQFAAVLNNPTLKVSADMPKDPALIGVSLNLTAPNSFEFRLYVPSSVGPVVEKGIVPLFQSLRPPGNP